MKTAVMTDTNSGISLEEGNKLGIFVLPMPVIVDGNCYLEHKNITNQELYQAILDKKDVNTSQPSPGCLMEMWDQIFEQGYDSIVHIPMSSGLSSSCEMAKGFAKEYNGKVQIVDNHRIAVTLRDSVLEAKELADKGLNAKQIKDHLDKNGSKSRIFIAVNTLDLLRKSGRVTPAAAAIASVFHIMPILSIKEGKLDAFAKARGTHTCEKKICESVRSEIEKNYSDIDPSRIWIGAAGTFADPKDAETWYQTVKKSFPEYNTYYNDLSCSIACHVSVNAIGVGVSYR